MGAFGAVRVEARFRLHTLVRATLETGRTHQIRVHLSHVGYPLVGDVRYGAKRKLPKGATTSLAAMLTQFPRQALHAQQLGFVHPESQEWLSFAVPMPDDMAALVQLLEQGHHGVALSPEGWDRLITWIDLNAPFHGTWTEAAGDPGEQRQRRIELARRYGGPACDPEADAQRPPAQVLAPHARRWRLQLEQERLHARGLHQQAAGRRLGLSL